MVVAKIGVYGGIRELTFSKWQMEDGPYEFGGCE